MRIVSVGEITIDRYLNLGRSFIFPAYLDGLEAQPADTLRDRVVQSLISAMPAQNTDQSPAESNTVTSSLEDKQAFLQHIAQSSPDSEVDQVFYSKVYELLNEPATMQHLIISHLRTLWDDELEQEWERSSRNIKSMVYLLSQRSWPTESAGAAIRAFTQHELPNAISHQLAGIEHVIVVPSPHVRLHAARFDDTTIWVFVLADFWTLPLREEPINRSEVLGPLQALADDTRLRLLELLAANESMRGQDIVAQLDVSQPTVSRHLKQLRRADIVEEERGTDANKVYSLNRDTFTRLFSRLEQLLTTDNAQEVLSDQRLDQPQALRRFLDRKGQVTVFPRKFKDKQIVLEFLIEKFRSGKNYTEPQVNEVLNQWHTFGDPATLRRALVEGGLINRTDNGDQYWRPV